MGSLIKYMHEQDDRTSGDRGSLFWGRAMIDGAPFRGRTPPQATEAEMDAGMSRVVDAHNRMFDLSDPDQNRDYLKVMDMVANGRALLTSPRRFFKCPAHRKLPDGGTLEDVHLKVYVEWALPYMEFVEPSLTSPDRTPAGDGRSSE